MRTFDHVAHLRTMVHNKTMPRIILTILLSLLMSNPAHAEILIDTQKLINIYRKHFNQAIAADLYASPAENQAARKLRARILDYQGNKGQKLSQESIDKKWKEYIASEFKTEEEFKLKLKNSYITEAFIKQKFTQNQYFNDYFETVISKRISEDISNRYKILELAKTQNIEITPTQIVETQLQMTENWGGDAQISSFMKMNALTPDEIAFFIRSDLAKEAIINKILTSDLEKNSSFASLMNSAIYNHFSNFNETQSPDYYFTQAFISKTIPDAKLKIEKVYQESIKRKRISTSTEPSVSIIDMQAPVNVNSDLYLAPIKASVLKLSNNELLVNNAISPIIETDYGYHFFQVTDIEIPESLTYNSAKTIIYQKIKTQKARDFNSLFGELLK